MMCVQWNKSEEGLEVLPLKMPDRIGTRVRAILHADGSGSVELSENYVLPETYAIDTSRRIIEILKNLGYLEEGNSGFLLPACAKFWYENQLGSLTVFPELQSRVEVYELLESSSPCGGQALRELAFILPASYNDRRGEEYEKKKVEIYGARLGYNIFKGGGPFILEDSPDLAEEALRKLGYIDDDLNDDVYEAMLCFMNAYQNKYMLRKGGLLPCPTDSAREVAQKLRQALLSNKVKGRWQSMRRNWGLRRRIVTELEEAKILSENGSHSQAEILEAMRIYRAKEGLPHMRTFNGLAWRMQRHLIKNPFVRGEVEFLRWAKW